MVRAPSTIKSLLLKDKSWDAYLTKHGDSIREVVRDAINQILSCGLKVRGYATWVCSKDDCNHTKIIPHSCGHRYCNTCGKKLTDQWIENQKAILPDTEWQHITFTMPDVLWPFFEHNRKLLKKLSKLAARSLLKYARKKGILPGIFIALHTFGRPLNWHPHLHLSTTRGGLSDDRSQWKKLHFTKKAIMPQWRYAVITLLRKAYKAGELVIPPEMASQYPTKADVYRMFDEQYQRAWIIHFAKATKNPLRTINYLGRYLKRPPIAMSRLKHYDGSTVIFEYLNHNTGKHNQVKLSNEEFLERFIRHIPEKGFRMIRYYGFLANRVRNTLLPKVYNLLDQPERNAIKITYQDLMIRSFGLDPLKCILCQSKMLFTGITPGLSRGQLSKYEKQLALGKPIR